MFKKIIAIVLLGTCFSMTSVHASNKLKLEFLNDCIIQYAGNDCISEIKLTNNTNEPFNGTATLTMYHHDELFDGQGIDVLYNDTTSTWQNGTITFPTFTIKQGINLHILTIQTNIALVPGQYDYTLSIGGDMHVSYSGGAVIIYSSVVTPIAPIVTITTTTTTTITETILEITQESVTSSVIIIQDDIIPTSTDTITQYIKTIIPKIGDVIEKETIESTSTTTTIDESTSSYWWLWVLIIIIIGTTLFIIIKLKKIWHKN